MNESLLQALVSLISPRYCVNTSQNKVDAHQLSHLSSVTLDSVCSNWNHWYEWHWTSTWAAYTAPPSCLKAFMFHICTDRLPWTCCHGSQMIWFISSEQFPRAHIDKLGYFHQRLCPVCLRAFLIATSDCDWRPSQKQRDKCSRWSCNRTYFVLFHSGIKQKKRKT